MSEPIFGNEPIITINGTTLTEGQAMTLRVALTSFHAELWAHGLGGDEIGRSIAEGYMKCCEAMFRMIFK
jgi:hypothetical protein